MNQKTKLERPEDSGPKPYKIRVLTLHDTEIKYMLEWAKAALECEKGYLGEGIGDEHYQPRIDFWKKTIRSLG